MSHCLLHRVALSLSSSEIALRRTELAEREQRYEQRAGGGAYITEGGMVSRHRRRHQALEPRQQRFVELFDVCSIALF